MGEGGGREEERGKGRGAGTGLTVLWMTFHSVGVSSLHHRLGGGAWGEGAIMIYCDHDTVEPVIFMVQIIFVVSCKLHFNGMYRGRSQHARHEIKMFGILEYPRVCHEN